MLSAADLEHMICSAWGHRDAQKLIEADRKAVRLAALNDAFDAACKHSTAAANEINQLILETQNGDGER